MENENGLCALLWRLESDFLCRCDWDNRHTEPYCHARWQASFWNRVLPNGTLEQFLIDRQSAFNEKIFTVNVFQIMWFRAKALACGWKQQSGSHVFINVIKFYDLHLIFCDCSCTNSSESRSVWWQLRCFVIFRIRMFHTDISAQDRLDDDNSQDWSCLCIIPTPGPETLYFSGT